MNKIILYLFLFFFLQTTAQEYRIDSAFSMHGKKIVNPDVKLCITLDEKIYTAGTSLSGPVINRFLPNGELDTLFGNDGYAFINTFPNTCNESSIVYDSISSKIRIIGNYDFGSNIISIFQLHNDGSLDLGFGTSGEAQLNLPFLKREVLCSYINSDQSLLLSGYVVDSVGYYNNFICKVKPNGSLDSTFSLDGYFEFQLSNTHEAVYKLTAKDDGKIVMGGFYENGSVDNTDIFLMQLSDQGIIDSSFGVFGVSKIQLSTRNESLNDFLILNEKIYAVGYTTNPVNGTIPLLIRCTMQGLIDTAFNINGFLLYPQYSMRSARFSNITQDENKLYVLYSLFRGDTELVHINRFDTIGIQDSAFYINPYHIITDTGFLYTMASPKYLHISKNKAIYFMWTQGFLAYAYNVLCKLNTYAPLNVIDENKIRTLNTSIYPNPASNIIYIENELLPCNIKFYNSQGTICKEITLNENQIPISDLTSGTYIAHISSKKGFAFKKIIIQ